MQSAVPQEVAAVSTADLLAQARAAQAESRMEAGLQLASQAWSHAQSQGLLAEQIEAGRLRCFFLLRRGQLADMLAAAEALLPLQRAGGANQGLCEMLRWVALSAADQGDFETALAAAQEGRAAAQEMGDLRLEAVALNGLGMVFERMGDPWQAEQLMTEAAALVRQQATPFEQVVALNNLWTVAMGSFHLLRDVGREAESQQALQRALQLGRQVRPPVRELGDPYAAALSDSHLGETLLQLNQLDEAGVFLDSAQQLCQRHGFLALAGRVGCLRAELALARGHADAAYAALGRLLQDMVAKSNLQELRRLHATAYRCAKRLGLEAQALRHLEARTLLEKRRASAQLIAQSRYVASRIEARRQRAPDAPGLPEDAAQLRDPLTDLGNRRLMEQRLPELLAEAQARNAPLTLALVDLDHFSSINAQHGAAVGDQVLQALARMLQDNTRGSDLLLRYGGEEFLVVLPDTVPDRAVEVCERIRHCVEAYAWSELAPGLDVTLSIGLATAPPHSTDLLVARAESAMYRAKHLGRNRVALA
ncbi:GGDEF domain-containing protein [Pelomonas sp. SE-A7]|uniref:GGDEF domain-containing protein n=1 Tax=Pelomonas sp. SE-A7 TaxID=3054953 RepID=UPI00259CB17C|nr:GGDEF domain-containing protein [Pelomonas sp. SE-A7]MDM4768356.1 GGDEF domain-containing protein [Pelomonas sp. SE-A7]